MGSSLAQVRSLSGQLVEVEERLRERRTRLTTEETVFSRGGGLVETAADRELRTAAHLVKAARNKRIIFIKKTFLPRGLVSLPEIFYIMAQ